MELNIVLRTDTNDMLSIVYEGCAERAKLWADDLLIADADYASAMIETRLGAELFSRSVDGAWCATEA